MPESPTEYFQEIAYEFYLLGGDQDDLEVTEEGGRMADAAPAAVGDRPKARGGPQMGTLGSGNHFAELQYVSEIYDAPVAADDTAQTEQGVAVVIDLLANDSDAEDGAPVVQSVGAATSGAVANNGVVEISSSTFSGNLAGADGLVLGPKPPTTGLGI